MHFLPTVKILFSLLSVFFVGFGNVTVCAEYKYGGKVLCYVFLNGVILRV